MPAPTELTSSCALDAIPTALSDSIEAVISSIEMACDTVADYSGRCVTYLDKKTSAPRSFISHQVDELARPFWNLTAGVFRYVLAPISWHLPRQIVRLEGQNKIDDKSPHYQKIQRLSQEMGLAKMPEVFLKSKEAWHLPHGGWSGIFQPTLVTEEADANGVIKRQLLGIEAHETSIQMLSFSAIALSAGLLLTNLTSPSAQVVKLAFVIGSYLISYIATQVVIDSIALNKLAEGEKQELKNALSNAKALPFFASSAPLLSRIQSIPKALYLIPAYIRSAAV